jgi:hypothetical protein
MTVYTAICRAVHLQVLSGGTATFQQRAREGKRVTAMVTVVHRPNFSEAKDFGWLA